MEQNEIMPEEITTVEPNEEAVTPSTDNVVKSADEAVVYGKYRFEDIEEYIEHIDEISFLEATTMIKGIDRNLNSLESMKMNLDILFERDPEAPVEPDPETGLYVTTEQLGASVASKNLLEQSDEMAADANDFYANYKYNVETMNRLKTLLQKKIDAAEGQCSTKYINDEMIRMLEKRLRLLDPQEPNYEWRKRRFTNILAAFSDRNNLNYLQNRATTMLQNKAFVRDLKRELKDYKTRHLKALKRIAKLDQLSLIEYYLGCCMNSSVAGATLMIILNKIALAEVRSGNDAWVKVLVLNIVDIHKRFYDIGDGSKYLEKITDSFSWVINKVIGEFKPKIREEDIHLADAPTRFELNMTDYSNVLSRAEKADEDDNEEDEEVAEAPKAPLGRGITKAICYEAFPAEDLPSLVDEDDCELP